MAVARVREAGRTHSQLFFSVDKMTGLTTTNSLATVFSTSGDAWCDMSSCVHITFVIHNTHASNVLKYSVLGTYDPSIAKGEWVNLTTRAYGSDRTVAADTEVTETMSPNEFRYYDVQIAANVADSQATVTVEVRGIG